MPSMNSFDSLLKNTIAAIHHTPHQAVIEFAGAGSEALFWLHQVAGSSRTVLEATDRYAAESLTELLGFTPAQFTSTEVSQLMANRACLRASALSDSADLIGIGCTATIATDRTKKGDHRCHVSVQTGESLTTYSLTMTEGSRNRDEEEQLVSLVIINALAKVCGVSEIELPLQNEESVIQQNGDDALLDWLGGQSLQYISVDAQGILTAGNFLENVAVFPGSYNPLHDGHRRLADVARQRLGKDVCFEMTLKNADKDQISWAEAKQRADQFRNLGTVLFTQMPLFSQKANIFPNSVFVIGADTVARLIQPRFYDDDPEKMHQSFKKIQQSGCRFLVAGRESGDQFITLSDIEIPPAYQCLFEEIPESEFRMDISSTAIREGRQS